MPVNEINPQLLLFRVAMERPGFSAAFASSGCYSMVIILCEMKGNNHHFLAEFKLGISLVAVRSQSGPTRLLQGLSKAVAKLAASQHPGHYKTTIKSVVIV